MNKKISFPIAIIIIVVSAVLVGGLAVWQYLGIPKIEISGFRPIEKTQPKDETADWKVYRNEEYGFEIKYPKEWFVYEIYNKEWISFLGGGWIDSSDRKYNEGGQPGIIHYPREKERIDVSVSKLIDPDSRKVLDDLSKSSLKKEVKIGRENYEEIEGEGFSPLLEGEGYDDIRFRVIYLKHGEFLYRFDIIKDDPAMVVFNQMLSTFRFLE